jgi:hypothetical protein
LNKIEISHDKIDDMRSSLFRKGFTESVVFPDLYQPPYPVTGVAHERLVMEAMRSGICMSLFQASRHASRMAS